jgi:hypothetical protein
MDENKRYRVKKEILVRLEVSTAVTMKKAVFWDVTSCGSCWLLITANFVPNSPILVTLMMEVLRSSKTSVLTRATWHIAPEDGIHQGNPYPVYCARQMLPVNVKPKHHLILMCLTEIKMQETEC